VLNLNAFIDCKYGCNGDLYLIR